MKNNQITKDESIHTLHVSEDEAPIRIDIFLANRFPDYSRSFFKKLFNGEHITINESPATKSGVVLKTGDTITITFPQTKLAIGRPVPDDLKIPIVFEHPDFLIINKPAGLIVHDAPSSKDEYTLVDWLLNTFKNLKDVGEADRPGIVHRLDKNTTGLMVIPRNNKAHAIFGDMFRNREIKKTYWAVVEGHPSRSGSIDFSIERHPVKKFKMTHKAHSQSARDSYTDYETLKYFQDSSLVKALPKTGRTHQIRVHFNGIGHPLVGDHIYGKASKLIDRHALHAKGIAFDYKGKPYSFDSEIPEDMQKLLNAPEVPSIQE